ncbi:unnamed protein product [Symbiodinium necroappetens]|uniref:Uncharacterized protein n=1 Tax=Symbiodinium necroappetens TaxID=1628268 RepID=A0A812V4I7_9DINO|nr:unnamed protein product [Symbiodinium necroappetens]
MQTLPPESLVLVFYSGHGFCPEGQGNTFIVLEDAEGRSECFSLEHQLAREVASPERRRHYLTVCCICIGPLFDWKHCIFSEEGSKRPPERPRIDWCDTDLFLLFYACPLHAALLDCQLVRTAVAHVLGSCLDSFQSFLLMLKDEIRHMSLGYVEPDFFNGDSLNARSISMQRSSSPSYLQPIMTASVFDKLIQAPLLRRHLSILVRNELSEGVEYPAIRQSLVDTAAKLQNSAEASMENQLQALQQSRLVDVARVFESTTRTYHSPSYTAHRALETVSCESLDCIIAAVKEELATEDLLQVSSSVSNLLYHMRVMMDVAPLRREILAEDLLARGPRPDWDYVLIPGQEPAALSRGEQMRFTEKVQELLASTKFQPSSRILLARGCIWLMVGSGLADSEKQLFERSLLEHILDRKAKSPSWTFARPPQFKPFAMVPLGLLNLVALAGALLPKSSTLDGEACWLHVAEFKKLVRTWMDAGGFSPGIQWRGWHVQLLHRGRLLEDVEWLQSTSDLRIVAAPTLSSPEFPAVAAALCAPEDLFGTLQVFFESEVDGGEWLASSVFPDFFAKRLAQSSNDAGVRHKVSTSSPGEDARRCLEPRALRKHVWKELLRHAGSLPTREELAAPMDAGYAEVSPQPGSSPKDEVTSLLEQLSRFPASKSWFLKLLEVKELSQAESFSDLLEVARGLSQPVATRGSSSADIEDEIDEDLSQTLQKLFDDIGSVGVEQAISGFIEEWN